MFVVLHVLLNSLALLNPVQSYHPCSREYTDMQPFAMHYFQGCKGSLKSVSKILGVTCPLLLHWCSQFCMWCSTAQHCWTLITSTHPHSREYTDVQPFAMHYFRGGRASLNWLCINFRGEMSTVTTLMFAVLHVLLNSFALFKPIQSIHRYAFFCNAPFSRMQSMAEKFIIHLTQFSTVSSSRVKWSIEMLNSL